MKNKLIFILITILSPIGFLSCQGQVDDMIKMLGDSLYLKNQELIEAKEIVPVCWKQYDLSHYQLYKRQPNATTIDRIFYDLISIEGYDVYDRVLQLYDSYIKVIEDQYEPLIRLGKHVRCFESDYDLFSNHFQIIDLFESALTTLQIREKSLTGEQIFSQERKIFFDWKRFLTRQSNDYLKNYNCHSKYYRRMLLNGWFYSYEGTRIDYLKVYSKKITPIFIDYLKAFRFEKEDSYTEINDAGYELLFMKSILKTTMRIAEREAVSSLEEFIEASFSYFAENGRVVWLYEATSVLEHESTIPLFLLDSLYHSASMSDLSFVKKDYKFRHLLGTNNVDDLKLYIKDKYGESNSDYTRRLSLYFMKYFPDPDFLAISLELLGNNKTGAKEKDLARDNLIRYLSAPSVSKTDKEDIHKALKKDERK